jgi:hypothetical protein
MHEFLWGAGARVRASHICSISVHAILLSSACIQVEQHFIKSRLEGNTDAHTRVCEHILTGAQQNASLCICFHKLVQFRTYVQRCNGANTKRHAHERGARARACVRARVCACARVRARAPSFCPLQSRSHLNALQDRRSAHILSWELGAGIARARARARAHVCFPSNLDVCRPK